MEELNFSNIRNHDGSSDNGFEELVCQLAHLSPPENADYFVRKDGAGGDAGVECYWKLKNGSEHGWQAKYFLNALESGQWSQLSKSVKTALKKHPNLTKYYVCLPRDWNDSRKLGSVGKPVNSSWDKWQEHVAKWEALASSSGMKVEFTYWCKHDISLLLQRDEPLFSGRARYWFNSPVLTTAVFQKLAERSRDSLGERYTPEFHLDLPVAKAFDGLGKTKVWWDELEARINDWKEAAEKAQPAMASVEISSPNLNLNNVNAEVHTLFDSLFNGVMSKSFLGHISLHRQQLTDLMSKLSLVSDYLLTLSFPEKEKDQQRRQQSQFYKFDDETERLFNYLESNTCKAASERCVLLVGEAGIGKSHLLCDISLKRLKEGLPTLFVLGQHYQGGNPFNTLQDALSLNDISHQEFLGALDAAGEAKETNALIIIDAINEGVHRNDWEHHLGAFLTDILSYPNISIVFSCRSTYVDYLVHKELIGNPLVEMIHRGFSGFEHRAASKYLSTQGISKPSTPITAPEFTNPLFLKTCCKALKDSGQNSFPKGLQGITKLFNFYIDSMEQVVAKKKRYRPGDQVVKEALETLTKSLYPDHLFGLPLKTARELINQCDPKPNNNNEDHLFDILIQEGVLSEDLEYDDNGENLLPVVRFPYERFSDHFIAHIIANDISDESLESIFKEGGSLDHLFKNNAYYVYSGILSALSILIAERYHRELIDLIIDGKSDKRLFDILFTETLLWRAGESFTKSSLELLNKVSGYGFHSSSLDVLMALSTEPSHPWNAELLHRTLFKMPMAKRDNFWSTHIAVSDYDEEGNEEESILRSLIEWAHSGVMDQVEPERIHLCAIVLMWTTSTSNRKVRDQATKSIVRILSLYPAELLPILEKFCEVDDLYILERLYAVAYGVLSNIDDEQIIKTIADFVFKTVFALGHPPPHILLRDYATGVMELALVRGLVGSKIDPNSFRPPFSSEWPLYDPSDEELDNLMGDKYGSSIRGSVMGFPGDFGNYSMSYIHNWSPTPIKEGKPQTAYEHQCEFSENLQGELKKQFLAHIEEQKIIDEKPFDEKIAFEDINVVFVSPDTEKEKKPTECELLKDKIESILSPRQKEHFRWVMGLGRANSIASFSRKKAHRWVCKRAIELGWTKELFEEFESYHTSKDAGRSQPRIERIGKKYQWIAFFEFLAHLSDNCCYIDAGYSDVDYSKYHGAWQIHKRNIDPTCLLRKAGEDDFYNLNKEYWYQPFDYPFFGESLEELQEWLWDESIIPPFEKLLQVSDPLTNVSWCNLRSFANWNKKPKKDEDEIPYQDAWYRISSCIVHKDQVSKLEKSLKGKNLCDPHTLQTNSTDYQGFLKEYPWHPIYKDMVGWDDNIGLDNAAKIKHLVPIASYEWESGSSDQSLDSSLSLSLPAKEIVKALDLFQDTNVYGQWVNRSNESVFFDPSAQFEGPSAALINSDEFFAWLEKNDLQLIWFICGEKQLFTSTTSKFYGSLIYSGIYKLSVDGVNGDSWFIKEQGRDLF